MALGVSTGKIVCMNVGRVVGAPLVVLAFLLLAVTASGDGWVPKGNGGTGDIRQTSFVEITSDTSTTSTTWVDLLTVTVSTTGGALITHFTVSCMDTNPNAAVMFRLVIDGSAVRATAIDAPTADDFESAALVHKDAVSAAAHVVKIQWQVQSGTGNIQPVTTPNQSHASLLVEESGV